MEVMSHLALMIMVAGLICTVIPLLPGPIIIWVAAFVWAWADGFKRVGPLSLIVLFILMALTWASDWVLSALFTKKSGATWRTTLAAVLGGIVGAIGLGFMPVLGSLLGAAAGAFFAVIGVEFWLRRDWNTTIRASAGFMAGCLLSQLIEIGLALAMIAIFIWRAFS